MSEPTHELSSPDPDLDLGQVIGEYQIEEKIGQGGFGTVYRAVHPLIGKVVAIKVLARKFSADPEMISRFVAEARSVNQIRHRHIIDIFLFGALPDGRAYYVMEYLDGEALDAMIDREKRLTLEQALPILRAIARALDAAHAKGITHRDLKPENVFLVRDDSGEVWPKLLDFGIAKLLGGEDQQKHKTRTGIPIGTPYYMSPEQCRGKDVDHRTDYYAFGIVAYQMLTGEHPIDADGYMEIMIKQLNDEPVPPSVVTPELPIEIDDVIAWLMKKNRDERPPNLMAAMKRFDDIAEQQGIVVPRATQAFDSTTPPPGAMKTPSVPNAGLAATMPSQVELAPVAISKWVWIAIALTVASAIGAVVWFELPRHDAPRPVVVVPPVVITTPPPAPVPVAPPTPAAVVEPPPPAPPADRATKKKPKPVSTTKKPGHDDIIDVFGKDQAKP